MCLCGKKEKTMLKLKNISAGYQDKTVIQNLTLDFKRGEFCALLGPNGAGKSTLLKALIGFQSIEKGEILLKDKPLRKWNKNYLAQEISLIPQDFKLQFDHHVYDLVLMGRFPYLGYWQNYTQKDREITDRILKQLDLFKLKNKMFSQLSGGEKKRVSIARSLAQQTEIILMDEAFANLDINHQLEIMQLLSEINHEYKKMIILVSHNINLAADYCDRIIMMKEGKIIADGNPENTIKSETIRELYGTNLKIVKNPLSGKPNLIYPGK